MTFIIRPYQTSFEAGSSDKNRRHDLRKFLNRWDATIAGMESPPDDFILRGLLLRQIRGISLVKYDSEVVHRAREGAHEKSYNFSGREGDG